LKITLSEKDKQAIEKAINASGKTEALVKAENGKIVVLQVEKKKIV
jgi:hypothetical protein